jgi:N-acetylneuraminic acid mutarotase
MPTVRALLAAAVVKGTIYALGGTTMGLDKRAVVEAYDPETDTWTRRADLPTPRNSMSAVAAEGKIYASGGWGLDRPEKGWEAADLENAAAFSTVEIYDPETNAWVDGEDMPTARAPLAVSAVAGRIYAIGGGVRRDSRDEPSSVVEVYDPVTNRWAPGAPMPTPRFAPPSSVIDGRIFVTGGATSHGAASSQAGRMRIRFPLAVVEVYDPDADRWTTAADLSTPRGWHSTSVLGGKLYVIGGRSLSHPKGGSWKWTESFQPWRSTHRLSSSGRIPYVRPASRPSLRFTSRRSPRRDLLRLPTGAPDATTKGLGILLALYLPTGDGHG